MLKEDVLKFLEQPWSSVTPEAKEPVVDHTEPILGFRKAMVQSMTESLVPFSCEAS